MFDRYYDGYCPECQLADQSEEMWLNRMDLYECPTCRLQIALGTMFRAAILRRRGIGNLRDQGNDRHRAPATVAGKLLCRESLTSLYDPDGFNAISDEQALRVYLNEVQGVEG